MEKFIYDESNGLWYELQGDFYIPCLTVPDNEQAIGVWGLRHLNYIQEHKKAFYTSLLFADTLNGYLENINISASEMLDSLIREMSANEGITETLKAQNQMCSLSYGLFSL